MDALAPQSPRGTQAAHVLNRIANGPRPGDVARVAQMGAAAYIEEQLGRRRGACRAARPKRKNDKEAANRANDVKRTARPQGPFPRAPAKDTLGEDAGMEWRINSLDAHQIEQDMPDMLYSLDDSEVLTQTAQAALLRAVYSRHQLREVMADFWTNHFNIYALKNDGRSLCRPIRNASCVLTRSARSTNCWRRPRTALPCSRIWTTTRTGGATAAKTPTKTMPANCWNCTRWASKAGTRSATFRKWRAVSPAGR